MWDKRSRNTKMVVDLAFMNVTSQGIGEKVVSQVLDIVPWGRLGAGPRVSRYGKDSRLAPKEAVLDDGSYAELRGSSVTTGHRDAG